MFYGVKDKGSLAVTSMTVLLLVATVAVSVMIMTSVARNERYASGDDVSQAASVGNDCLNPILDSNTIDNVIGVTNCGSTVSQ
ncbi:MAG: hypothetical protein ACRD8W_09080 [Nitrososphaeraceae archaeon]|jgi:hypothetical protein